MSEKGFQFCNEVGNELTSEEEAAKLRTQSAERLQLQVAESLARIHTLLKPEQRARLAYLLRTGTLLM